MSTIAKFNTVTLVVVAALATIAASPSWAGEQTSQTLPASSGGMGFGPMQFSMLDAARPTKPIRGEEPASPARDQVLVAGRDRLPPPSAPNGLQPAVEQAATLTMASQQWADTRN